MNSWELLELREMGMGKGNCFKWIEAYLFGNEKKVSDL